MTTRQFPLKTRSRITRNASRKSATTALDLALNAIETERANLSRTESLLGCLTIAMEYGETGHEGPYYADVASMARELVRKSINALDPINLPAPSRDKVREDFVANASLVPTPLLEVALAPRAAILLGPPRRARLHRRDYARAAARALSSRDSASSNMSGCVNR